MHDNLFTFANNQSLEYDFLHWCLLWYKDKSEPRNPLFYMTKDLLAIMGEDQLTDDQEIDICRWEYVWVHVWF